MKVGQKLVRMPDGSYKVVGKPSMVYDENPAGALKKPALASEREGMSYEKNPVGDASQLPIRRSQPPVRRKSSGLGNIVRAGVAVATIGLAGIGINYVIDHVPFQYGDPAPTARVEEAEEILPKRLILAGIFQDYSNVENLASDFRAQGYEVIEEDASLVFRDYSKLEEGEPKENAPVTMTVEKTKLYIDVSDGWLDKKEVMQRLATVHRIDDAQEWELDEGEFYQINFNRLLREAIDRYVADTEFKPEEEAKEDLARILPEMVRQESRYVRTAISNKGATGFLQVMPPTAEDIEERIRSLPEFAAYRERTGDTTWRPDNPLSNYGKYLHNATLNLDDAVAYAWHLYNLFDGDPEKWVAAYNAGPSNYNRGFPETEHYRKTILSRSAEYGEEHLAALGFR